MNFARSLSLFLLLVCAACGGPRSAGGLRSDLVGGPNLGIVGGRAVSSHDWIAQSAVAVLVISPRGADPEHIIGTCSGTLIQNDLVVTAAHCIQDHAGLAHGHPVANPHTKFAVYFARRLGFAELTAEIKSKTFTSDPRIRMVGRKDVRVKPGFVSESDDEQVVAGAQNDVALMKLSTEAPAGYSAMPVLRDQSLIHAGSRVIIAGFGPTKSDDLEKGEVLRFLDTTIHTALSMMTKQTELNTTSGRGLISGDSGGPGYVRLKGRVYLWGAASASFEDGSAANFESLPFDFAWLRVTARELGSELK